MVRLHAIVACAVLVTSISTTALALPYRQRYPLPQPGVPQSLGVNIHFTTPRPGEMRLLAKEGFKWIRTDFSWQGTERTAGVYDFSAYDVLMRNLKRYGIRPIFIFDYGNDLYQAGSPTTPTAINAFCKWVRAAVTHFREDGVVWEMWNEPNIGFWKPKPDVQQYINLAKAVGTTIRTSQPQEWFIGPGVSGMDLGFIETCFKQGLLSSWDAVSFHPYRDSNPESAARDYKAVAALIHHYAPTDKQVPMLASEWGYSELYPGMNTNRQARFAVREFLTNISNSLVLTIWYDWHDDGVDAHDPEDHFGTVTVNYQPKPVYTAIQTLAKTLHGFVYVRRLNVGAPQDWCLLFKNHQRAEALAFWRTSGKPGPVNLPLLSDHAVLVSMLGTRSDARDAIQVVFTHQPQYMFLGQHPTPANLK